MKGIVGLIAKVTLVGVLMIGGIAGVCATGVPAGLGEPVFD